MNIYEYASHTNVSEVFLQHLTITTVLKQLALRAMVSRQAPEQCVTRVQMEVALNAYFENSFMGPILIMYEEHFIKLNQHLNVR